MKWDSISSFLLSILALLGTLYTDIVHTKNLNNQQKQINDYLIKKEKEEEENKKKALVCAETFKSNDGWKIKIFNTGESIARNIRIYSKEAKNNNSGIHLYSKTESYPFLNKGGHYEIEMNLCKIHYPTVIITLIWDDEFEKNREREEALNLTF